MVKQYSNFNINKLHRGSIILIGNFDGLHLGHQKLFQLAQSYKKKYNLKIGVVNFDPMPKMFFNKNLKNFRLSNIDQKIKLLGNLKVDFVITKKFDKKFSKTKALNFISQILNTKTKKKQERLINQSLDLAKLSHGLLKGEELTNFINRSFDIIK